MQVVQAIGAVKVSNRTSVGIRTLNIKQKVVGMVLRGTKKIYHDDRVTIAEAGDIFLLNEGLHHIEECADNQLFEQILFYITAEELHKHIVTLIQQYQLECFTTHHCRKCQSNNFVVSKPNKSLSEFFSSINNTFTSAKSQIGEHLRQMRTIELVYHILCSEDGCLKNQLLQGADIDRVKFMGCIYDHILKECTVESLAAATHRSPTSFKRSFVATSTPRHISGLSTNACKLRIRCYSLQTKPSSRLATTVAYTTLHTSSAASASATT